MIGGSRGHRKRKEHVNYRIACSVLLALGAIGLTETATAAATEKIAPDSAAFGQVVGTTVVLTSPIVALSTVACPDGNVCFWKQQNFSGDRKMADGGDAGDDLGLGAWDRSVKNRFASRRVQIKDADGDILDCVNAGDEEDNLPARADIFRIGVSGSSC